MVDYGILVLATKRDWYKAAALSITLKLTNRGIKTAVVADRKVLAKLRNHYDFLVPELPDIRGFAHKLWIDQYSPFSNTLFIDSDTLVMKSLQPLIDAWNGAEFAVRGTYVRSGESWFGLNRQIACVKLKSDSMVCIDSAGHYYFEKPGCYGIFERAREIAENYHDWVPNGRLADEDVFAIAMTQLKFEPTDSKQIVGFPVAAKRNSLRLSIKPLICEYTDLDGDCISPYILHFFNRQFPVLYHCLLLELSNLPPGLHKLPILFGGLEDFWQAELRIRLSRLKGRLLGDSSKTRVN